MLNEEQIINNWNKFNDIIQETISDSNRMEKISNLLSHFGNRLSICPASMKEGYHSAYPGGLIYHTLNVLEIADLLYEIWKQRYEEDNSFTEEELVFSCLFHDIGKIGDVDIDFYIDQTSDWHRKNRGEVYMANPEITYMSHADRSLYLLQLFGIELTENEWTAIKLHDGPLDKSNEKYFNNSWGRGLKSYLPYLVHQADMMASFIEKHQDKVSNQRNIFKDYKSKKVKKKEIFSEKDNEKFSFNIDDIFVDET